jgi:hypothetical protein
VPRRFKGQAYFSSQFPTCSGHGATDLKFPNPTKYERISAASKPHKKSPSTNWFGGDFWQGFTQSAIFGGANHALGRAFQEKNGFYRVKEGDTWESIACKLNISERDLKALNKKQFMTVWDGHMPEQPPVGSILITTWHAWHQVRIKWERDSFIAILIEAGAGFAAGGLAGFAFASQSNVPQAILPATAGGAIVLGVPALGHAYIRVNSPGYYQDIVSRVYYRSK